MNYVKSKLEKIKETYGDDKFLLSDSYRAFLQRIVNGVTGNYELDVKLSNSVCTDGKTVFVNPVHPYVNIIKELSLRTLVILGQLAHETFHLIYTDFSTLKVLENKYGKLGQFRLMQVHECFNIIEDAAIELAGTNYYTGSFKQAIIANNQNALENMQSLDDLQAQNVPRLSVFKMACAMYCILGTQKGSLQDPELIDLFAKAMPIMDEGRLAPQCFGRLEAAERLYDLMMPLIEEVERQQKQMQSQDNYQYTKSEQIPSGGNGQQSMSSPPPTQDFQQDNKQQTKKKIEQQQKGSGSSGDDKDDKEQQDSSKDGSNGKAKGKDGKKDGSSSDSDGKDGQKDEKDASSAADGKKDTDKNAKDQSDGNSGDKSDKADSDAKDNGNSTKDGDSKDSGDEGNKDASSQQDPGSKGKSNSEQESNNSDSNSDPGQMNSKDAENKSEAEKAQEEMEKMLKGLDDQLKGVRDNAVKEEYDKKEQQKQDKAIKEFGKTVSYSDLHRGMYVEANRSFPVQEYHKQYCSDQQTQIKSLTRNLTKRLVDIIKYNEDQKMSGLYDGKINRNQLSRADKRVFFRRKEKSDEADLAILMLVDQSGSMRGPRIKYARLACMMMYDVCKELDIPLAIIGHWATNSSNRINHNHFVDFESRNPNEKYSLAYMTDHENTREGVSLKYAGEYLRQRPEQEKILISISDGSPQHRSAVDMYIGETARKDTGRVVKELESDLKVFGVAIGDGKSEIKQIYTKNFIDVTDITKLPPRLVSLIEKNLFV